MAQKRHTSFIQDDLQRIANPDISRPFSSLDDVVERLLPYHVFIDPEEAEAEKSSTTTGRRLEWLQMLSQQNKEHRAKLSKLEQRLQVMEDRLDGVEMSGGRLDEEVMLERFLHDQEKELWLQAKAEQQQREAAEQRDRLAAVQAAFASQASHVAPIPAGSGSGTSLLVTGAQLGLSLTSGNVPGSVSANPGPAPSAGIPGSWQQVRPSVGAPLPTTLKAEPNSIPPPAGGVVGSWTTVQQPAIGVASVPASVPAVPANPAQGGSSGGTHAQAQDQGTAVLLVPQPAASLSSGWQEVSR